MVRKPGAEHIINQIKAVKTRQYKRLITEKQSRKQYLETYFGCHNCLFIGTELCPHKLKKGQQHSNKICQLRHDYIVEQLHKCSSAYEVVQNEELFKLKQMSDAMFKKWADTGEVPSDVGTLSKLIISLTDKIRRQNEGTKISGEIELKNFVNMVNTQAELVKDKDIIKEAQFVESTTRHTEEEEEHEEIDENELFEIEKFEKEPEKTEKEIKEEMEMEEEDDDDDDN